MERINERIALRTRFMNELYEMANGSDIDSVSTGKIAEKLSLDYKNEKDHRELLAIIKYLEGEYLIKSFRQ